MCRSTSAAPTAAGPGDRKGVPGVYYYSLRGRYLCVCVEATCACARHLASSWRSSCTVAFQVPSEYVHMLPLAVWTHRWSTIRENLPMSMTWRIEHTVCRINSRRLICKVFQVHRCQHRRIMKYGGRCTVVVLLTWYLTLHAPTREVCSLTRSMGSFRSGASPFNLLSTASARLLIN